MSLKNALSLICAAQVLLFCGEASPPASSEFVTKTDAAAEEASSELTCTFRFFNCDNDPSNGCETDTVADNNNCGGCGKTCATQCVAGSCARPDCPKGMWECNQNGSDGCETNLETSASNCGECSHSCLGGTCTSGVCASAVLSKAKDSPFGIAVNATHVFFTTADGNVVRTALDGSDERTIATGRKNLRAIQLDGTHVYWTEEGLGDNDGILGRATLDGVCATSCPDVVVSLLEHPRAFALDGQHAYIVNFATGAKDGSIVKVSKAGGTGEKILTSLERPWGIAADPNTIFFTQENRGLFRSKTDGSTPLQVGTGTGSKGVAMDPSYAYFATDKNIFRVARASTGGKQDTIASGNILYAVMADSNHVYYTTANEVKRTPKDGNCVGPCPVTMAKGALNGILFNVSSLAQDAKYLYWTNVVGTTVERAPK